MKTYSYPVDAPIMLIATKNISAKNGGISGAGRFPKGTKLAGYKSYRACTWQVWERGKTWPWAVHVPGSFLSRDKGEK